MATDLTGTLECYLDTATLQLKTTAANMANVDTPGYKTRGIDFGEQMARALKESQEPGLMDAKNRPDVNSLVDGLISRPDGNNVSMDREGMKMSEAQLKFRTGVALLKQEIAQVSEAIHSDSK
jgi:flagellar basal-body rod protein FlgB